MDYKVSYALSVNTLERQKQIVITDCRTPNDATETLHEEYPNSIIINIVGVKYGLYEWKIQALCARDIDYLITHRFSPNGNEFIMVVKHCHTIKEAEEGFRCLYKRPETFIVKIEIWDGKLVEGLENEWNVLTLQELREYRDNG